MNYKENQSKITIIFKEGLSEKEKRDHHVFLMQQVQGLFFSLAEVQKLTVEKSKAQLQLCSEYLDAETKERMQKLTDEVELAKYKNARAAFITTLSQAIFSGTQETIYNEKTKVEMPVLITTAEECTVSAEKFVSLRDELFQKLEPHLKNEDYHYFRTNSMILLLPSNLEMIKAILKEILEKY